MNSELYGNEYNIPERITKYIESKKVVYPNSEGIKRANNLTKSGKISYSSLKRLKNFFDTTNPTDNKIQYELAGGDLMKKFVEVTLSNERKRTGKSKETNRDINVDLQTDKIQNIGKSSIHESQIKDELTINVSAIILDKDRRILLLKRSNFEDQWQPNKWAVVGGKVESGEDEVEAVKREIKEETGIDIETFIEKFVIQRSSDAVEHIYVAKYSGEPEDVELNQEHNGFMWVRYAEIRYLDTVPNLIDYINIAISKY